MRQYRVEKKGKGFAITQTDTLEIGTDKELRALLERQEAELLGCRAQIKRLTELEEALTAHISSLTALVATLPPEDPKPKG